MNRRMLVPVRQHNPFATRFIRPGAHGFLFFDGHTPQSLIDRLKRFRCRAQIVGPHGSGKTTLLHTMRCPLEQQCECRVVWRCGALRTTSLAVRWQNGLKVLATFLAPNLPQRLLVIDGFEQLPWLCRQAMIPLARLCRSGLLITTHHPVRLPVLYRLSPSLHHVRRIVGLVLEGSPRVITDDDIGEVYARYGANVREILFALYDRYAARTSPPDRRETTSC